MINSALYKQGIKSNLKLFLIFIAILTMYITIIVSMFNPEYGKALEEFSKSMPEIMAIVGMNGDSTTLNGFLITYLYGFLFLIFPMVFSIILSNRLVASYVDKGSMVYLLASPNNRKKIVLTQVKVIGTFIFMLISYCTIISIIVSQLMFPGELKIIDFLGLNFGLLIFHIALSGICFISSCIFDESKNSLLVGAGIPLIFFLIQMLVNVGEKLEFFKYITIFSLFDPTGLNNKNSSSYLMIGILFIIGIIIYSASISIFKRRDLSV